jgi:hypothetical protein
MDTKHYWNYVHLVETKLRSDVGDVVFIVSVEQMLVPEWKTGVVSVVPPRVGAQRIVEGTHRQATSEEIAAYQRQQAARAREDRELAQLRMGRRFISADPGKEVA